MNNVAKLRNLFSDSDAPRRCTVIAELGVNHNGVVERGRQLIETARRTGVDGVKLQLFVPDELCSRVHRADETEMLESLRMPEEEQQQLCEAARAAGLALVATPFDMPSLQLLQRLDIPVIKIGSGEITHTPLLAAVARMRKPVILSTGGCAFEDVDRAVTTLRDNGCDKLCLLHCVSAYPPPDAEVNLRVISSLKQRYHGVPIGFSDHTIGIAAAVAAVAMGAVLIEKHLTLDCLDEGPDHAASADPPTMAALVNAIRRVDVMLGDGEKRVAACEGTIGRSVVAARDLPAGHRIATDDVAYKRPGDGVRPYLAHTLIGRWLTRAIARDEQIMPHDVAETPRPAPVA
ncbi:MAG: N-acetylneuraminate synthase family protein [Phycisphaerae bacterium]|nr:N-acetylneuraminate synthase family protein [Phycisphaerae bacterium]